MRIGSLFSGAGGLDMAVEQVFGGHTVWHCEVDPAASKVLAHRWPGVPNHTDITAVDWTQVEPVDVLCGGYPCQPFSSAGQRKGADDERHLWPYFAEAICHLRPRLVVLENVAGHRSMGFDRVLANLAGLRYDSQWVSLRASDIGAPHRRERLFVVANPEHSTRHREWARAELGQGNSAATDTGSDRLGGYPERDGEPIQPELAASFGHDTDRRNHDAALSGDGPVDLLPTPAAKDGGGGCVEGTLGGKRASGAHRTISLATAVHHELLPTPAASDGAGGKTSRSGDRIDEPLLGGIARDFTGQWGKYEPAIRRWEQVTRPAPSPTEPNKNGNPRLSAAFSEWMLGWPDGWVTQVPGISRNDQLRIIGNGVCPAQAEAALRYLLTVAEVAA